MRVLFNIYLVWICCQGWSQQKGLVQPGDLSIERYRVLTDRSIYIVGEVINFRVFNLSSDSLQELDWSKVFYIELISPDGFSHTQAKFTMDSTGAAGALKVPGDLPSGTYFLKGYTRWMRNYGPAKYTYLSVEIINPFKKFVLPVDTSSNFGLSRLQHKIDPKATGLVLGNHTDRYAKRAPVHLDLSVIQDNSPVHCCVTVIRKGILGKQWESVPSSRALKWDRIKQIPETRGISLTGKVEFAGSGLPSPFAVVYISLMGKERDFYCNYADSTGRFYFAFPDSYGETDLFISASHPDPYELDLFIEQDFCTEPITLPSYPLEIDQIGVQLIEALSLNAQIRDQYANGHTDSDDSGSPQMKFFYGDPSAVIKFDDFIKLPTMEEYFTEVTPQVSLRKSNRRKRFRVVGDHPDLEFYAPLVMIDGVAIFNVESVLDISPRYIDRVEIVDAPYIKGNVTFGGIINIITRNDDMGFIDMPSSGLLVNYQMLDQPLPDHGLETPSECHLPDVRNTLFWDPDMALRPGETIGFSFYTSDVKGDYEILVRGYDSSGKYISKSVNFSVE